MTIIKCINYKQYFIKYKNISNIKYISNIKNIFKHQNGFTPLHIASREGHELMVQLLLVQRAEVNCSSKIGLTPLHLAARENHVGVAKLLVLYKAIIDPQTLVNYFL